MRLTIIALQALAVSGFVMQPASRTMSHRPLFMSTVENTVPITVTGDNIEVTESLLDYVNTKLERPLGKLRSNGVIKDCAVHLIVNKNPKVSDVDVSLSSRPSTVRDVSKELKWCIFFSSLVIPS